MTTFAMPLSKRLRVAARRRDRYRTDNAYRLHCINHARAQRGAPPIASLDQMGDRKRGRVGAERGPDGRYLPAEAR